MATPTDGFDRSPEQRDAALVKANAIRTWRKEFKQDLKAGRVDPIETLKHPDERLLTAKVHAYLMWCPKIGRVKANRLLSKARISPSKQIGGLSSRQRAELILLMTQREWKHIDAI